MLPSRKGDWSTCQLPIRKVQRIFRSTMKSDRQTRICEARDFRRCSTRSGPDWILKATKEFWALECNKPNKFWSWLLFYYEINIFVSYFYKLCFRVPLFKVYWAVKLYGVSSKRGFKLYFLTIWTLTWSFSPSGLSFLCCFDGIPDIFPVWLSNQRDHFSGQVLDGPAVHTVRTFLTAAIVKSEEKRLFQIKNNKFCLM